MSKVAYKKPVGPQAIAHRPRPRPRPRPAEKQPDPANVLILEWDETDLNELLEETEKVKRAFRTNGYRPKVYRIPLANSWEKLEVKLRLFLQTPEGLRIIYYHGHGRFSISSSKVAFYSHRDKPYKVSWDPIGTMIMNAPCDVLTILDCCEGGGAAVPLPNNNPNIPLYGKELIAASSWSTKSYGRMSEALCRVLPTLNKAGKSVQDFVALLDTELKSMLKSRWEELDKKLMELDEEQKNLQRKTKRLAELCREVEKLELYKMRREAKKKLEKEKGNERRRPMPQGKSTSGVNQQLLGLREEIDELNKEKLPNEADLILRKSKLEEKVGQLKQKHGQPVHRRLQTSVRTRAPSQTRSPNKIIIKNFNAPNAPSAPS